MQVRRNPEVPMLRSEPQFGEVTVAVDDRILSLKPICALMVNFSSDWIDLPTLVTLTREVVDPDGSQPNAEEFVRENLLGLVTMGVLQTRD